MKKNIAINGFGRIGRMVLRASIEQNTLDHFVAINSPGDIATMAHLFKYDSIHGVFRGDIIIEDNMMIINDHKIHISSERDPTNAPWQTLDIDLVMECSGVFTNANDAKSHIVAGAHKVIISAPGKDCDKTIVYGVNHETLQKNDTIISCASCTTNCLAPVTKVLHDHFVIEHGFMTTIHSYTGDQNIIDASHKNLRRARAAGLSIVPTTTGAAEAIGLVMPELSGKLQGTALRVPTPNVSLVDLTATVKESITKDIIANAFTTAANTKLKNILGVNSLPLVSCDFNQISESSIVDIPEIYVTGNHMVRVMAWYDNEWGFSCRMIDLATYMMDL